MATVTIETEEATPPVAPSVETSTTEIGAPLAEAVETASNSEVEIAQIQADAQVEIAQTHAAVEVARIEAQTDNEVEQWRSRSMTLEAENTELRARVASLEAMSVLEELQETPSGPSPLEPETVEMVTETLTPSEPDLTPTSTLGEISSTATEALVKSEGDSLEVLDLPPVLTVPKPRPTIRLV